MAGGQLRECLIPSLSEPPQSPDVVIEAARLLREPHPGLMLVGPCRVGRELVGSQPLGARGHPVEERRTIGVDAHADRPEYTRMWLHGAAPERRRATMCLISESVRPSRRACPTNVSSFSTSVG